jgi:hypothetical protein
LLIEHRDERPGGKGSPAEGKGEEARPQLDCLDAVRFLAQVQMVACHEYLHTESGALNNLNQWNVSALDCFFVLAGKL